MTDRLKEAIPTPEVFATILALEGPHNFQYPQDLRLHVLDTIVERLRDEDKRSRIPALLALRNQQDHSPEVLGAIVKMLADTEESSVCRAAISALRCQHNLSPDILRIIIELLEGTEARLFSSEAIDVIQRQKTLCPDILNTLAKWTELGTLEISSWAIQALQMQGSMSSEDVETYRIHYREGIYVCRDPIGSLQPRPGPGRDIIRAFFKRLEDTRYSGLMDRVGILMELSIVRGMSSNSTVSDNIKGWVMNDDESLACDALTILEGQKYLSPEVTSYINRQLENSRSPYVRIKALEALQKRHYLSFKILEVIPFWLNDQDLCTRLAALEAFRYVRNLGSDLLYDTMALLVNKDLRIRIAAVRAFQNQPDLSPEIIKSILEGLQNTKDRDFCEAALKVFQEQQSPIPETFNAILTYLGDPECHFRIAVVNSLGSRRSLSLDILNAVVKCFSDKDWRVRLSAVEILQHQKNLTQELLNATMTRVEDEDWRIRLTAVKTFQDRLNLGLDHIKAAVGRLMDDGPDIRWAAADVLRNRQDLHLSMLESIIGRLHRSLLNSAFSQNIHWVIADESLNMVFDSQILRFHGSSSQLQSISNMFSFDLVNPNLSISHSQID
ncbi:hypothetical protein N7540_000092 [Penicillium herquei]|nr:hypothetical protein N7540_000092 [Penicillium herquei]